MPFNLHIQTRSGVHDLARIVGVLALYDLTPSAMTANGDAGGLKISSQFVQNPDEGVRCLNRIRQLNGVMTAEIVAVPDCRT